MNDRRDMLRVIVAGLLLIAALGVGVYMNYDVARRFLKKEEGEKLKKYLDIAGHWSIGIGHKILPGESLDTITPDQSAALFEKDVSRIDSTISKAIKVPLTVNQKAAVLSIAFNNGAEAIAASTLVKKLNAGDFTGAAAEFARWNIVTQDGRKVVSPALAARRGRERDLFLS